MHMDMNLTSKGQVTIPKIFRDALGVKPGGRMRFEMEGDRIVLTRAQPKQMEDPGERVLRALVGKGNGEFTTEEIMRMSRGNDWNSPVPHD